MSDHFTTLRSKGLMNQNFSGNFSSAPLKSFLSCAYAPLRQPQNIFKQEKHITSNEIHPLEDKSVNLSDYFWLLETILDWNKSSLTFLSSLILICFLNQVKSCSNIILHHSKTFVNMRPWKNDFMFSIC